MDASIQAGAEILDLSLVISLIDAGGNIARVIEMPNIAPLSRY